MRSLSPLSAVFPRFCSALITTGILIGGRQQGGRGHTCTHAQAGRKVGSLTAYKVKDEGII